MSKMFNVWKSKSVMRYIIVFSTVMILIFLAMGTYLYRFYYGTIYNDFLASNESELENIAVRHENEMQMIEDITLQMSLETDIINFRLEDKPEKSIKLKERLYQYTIVSRFFDFIFYCYHEDHYLFNQTTSLDIDFFLNQGIVLEEEGRGLLKDYLYDDQAGLKVIPEQVSGGYLLGNYPMADKSTIYLMPVVPSRTGTMAFVINERYYDELLESVPDEKRQSFILFEGREIVSRGSLEPDREAFLREAASLGKGQKRVALDGEKYLLSVTQSASGLTYCTLQSMDIFQDKILSQQWGILILLAVCSVPASLVIISVSRAVSSRVRKLNMLLERDQEDYYSLDSIESGIQMLTQSRKETVQDALNYRKTIFIRSFVKGDYPETEIYQAAEKAGLSLPGDQYIVVLMGNRGNSNESRAHGLMLAEIEKESLVDGYGVRLVNNSQSLFVLFGEKVPAIEQVLQRMLAYGREYCEDFIMAVSDYHEDYAESSKAYLEADAAFDSRFLMDNSEILRFGALGNTETAETFSDSCIGSLKNAIRTGNEAEMQRIVQDICSRLKRGNHSLITFRILCNDLIHMLLTEFQDSETDLKSVYNVFMLSQCLNIRDFKDVLCETCRLLMSNRISQDGTECMVSRAITYMQEQYSNPELNMSLLAEYLGISPVTLAVEFKNGAGVSPSDYLAGVRMEKAKELLGGKRMLVKEISLAVGYEDEHVFIRRFKRYTGKTPGQYRMERME